MLRIQKEHETKWKFFVADISFSGKLNSLLSDVFLFGEKTKRRIYQSLLNKVYSLQLVLISVRE